MLLSAASTTAFLKDSSSIPCTRQSNAFSIKAIQPQYPKRDIRTLQIPWAWSFGFFLALVTFSRYCQTESKYGSPFPNSFLASSNVLFKSFLKSGRNWTFLAASCSSVRHRLSENSASSASGSPKSSLPSASSVAPTTPSSSNRESAKQAPNEGSLNIFSVLLYDTCNFGYVYLSTNSSHGLGSPACTSAAISGSAPTKYSVLLWPKGSILINFL